MPSVDGFLSSLFIYLFNVHRDNTRENNITKGSSMPLTGDKSTMVASMQVTLPIPELVILLPCISAISVGFVLVL